MCIHAAINCDARNTVQTGLDCMRIDCSIYFFEFSCFVHPYTTLSSALFLALRCTVCTRTSIPPQYELTVIWDFGLGSPRLVCHACSPRTPPSFLRSLPRILTPTLPRTAATAVLSLPPSYFSHPNHRRPISFAFARARICLNLTPAFVSSIPPPNILPVLIFLHLLYLTSFHADVTMRTRF